MNSALFLLIPIVGVVGGVIAVLNIDRFIPLKRVARHPSNSQQGFDVKMGGFAGGSGTTLGNPPYQEPAITHIRRSQVNEGRR